MGKKSLLFRMFVLVAAMMCALGASAAEAYACYTSSNTTLTFYYDNYRSTRPGTSYDLNTGYNEPGWHTDGCCVKVTKVVFDSSFANARPMTTRAWFYNMSSLESITGMSYLNTSEVTDMEYMFTYCNKLTSLDLSHFNTSKVTSMVFMFWGSNALTSLDLSGFNTSNVTNMGGMFNGCTKLETIYVGSGWSTAAVIISTNMFRYCTSLVGCQGTIYDANHIDKEYAHIDGGPSNPGYFTEWKEAYACYTPSNTTLTFYYDNYRSSRPGTTYDLNEGDNDPGWYTDDIPYDVTKVVFAPSFANARPTTTYSWFAEMEILESITGLQYLNTSEVTNMSYMFAGCSSVTTLDVSGFDTRNVTNMYGMFAGCSSVTTLDLSGFDTRNVTDMGFMFSSCGVTALDVSGFDTRNVTNMAGMFGCGSVTTLDVSSLDTRNVTNMAAMFNGCESVTTLDLSGFDTRNVTNMREMFAYCYALTTLDLSSFNTSQVTNMSSLFNGCTNLQTIYVGNGWTTAAVTSSSYMFNNCTSLVGGQGTTWNSSNPTDKTYAHIDGGPSNPGYFTEWKEAYACYTSSNKTLTFYYDNYRSTRPGTTYDLNTGSNNAGWDTDGTNASVTKVVFDPSFAGARPTTTYYWFYDMTNLQSITGMSYLNTSEVTNMAWMFTNCKKLTSLDVSHFNTAKVTNMVRMFNSCSGLTSLDLSSFNTANVTGMMNYMFNGCSGLTSLDLSSFNTANVTGMSYMFNGCTNLQTIYVGNGWSTEAVTESSYMFRACTSLVGGKGTTYDVNHVDKTYAHIDGGPSNPGYFTEWKEAYACYTSSNKTLTFYYDNYRSTRPGTTYDLNQTTYGPRWESDGTNANVTKVVFDSSFANARPTTTYDWFFDMQNLESITGMSYLNTSKVTNMGFMFMRCPKLTSVDLSNFNTERVISIRSMFRGCSGLTSLDLSSFNTSNVLYVQYMFEGCENLQTVYVGDGWSTEAVTESSYMFRGCTSLVGGKGTTYDVNHVDKTYAHIDGGPSNPGYFTEKNPGLLGDMNGDNKIDVEDVNALINIILKLETVADYPGNGDMNGDNMIDVEDVNAVINVILKM